MDAPILPALENSEKIFLSGPFGSGKSTQAIARVRWLLAQERIRGDDILVLAPQRTLAQPYYDALRSASMPPGSQPHVTTLASLIRNAVELYWPLIKDDAGFADTQREPTFLTLETSQYHMARFVDGALGRGELDGVRIERNRVISQVLDNLNKAALNQMSIEQSYQRLELAVPPGEQLVARLNALRAALRVSEEFRQLCLQETLLDFSLQVQIFNEQILEKEWSRTHLHRRYRHLIYDNIEEDTWTAHRFVQGWMQELSSALLISDTDSGFRTFLGADPRGVDALQALCDRTVTLASTHVMSTSIAQLEKGFEAVLAPPSQARRHGALEAVDVDVALANFVIPEAEFRFYPQMIDWVVEEVADAVHQQGVAPHDIALLAPFVSDALRFSMQTGLAQHDIELTTHRPSRALQDEPAARCLLTLAALAHPHWGLRPAPSDVALALAQSIEALDPVRAHLLTQIVYPARRSTLELGRFGTLIPTMQERITFAIGEAYDRLREWIYDYRAAIEIVPLDQFFAALFGERLSQPGFGFHDDFDAARVANQLVESARKFRWALESDGRSEADLYKTLGQAYARLFESGALGALYVPGWREPENAVFLAPAYTFLMRNRAVDLQFWLDIGAGGWWERLYQPLTHPYVLSPRWPAHRRWLDEDEENSRQETLRRLLLGLVRRTRRRVYVGISNYSEQGFEQHGPLLGVVNRLLARKKETVE